MRAHTHNRASQSGGIVAQQVIFTRRVTHWTSFCCWLQLHSAFQHWSTLCGVTAAHSDCGCFLFSAWNISTEHQNNEIFLPIFISMQLLDNHKTPQYHYYSAFLHLSKWPSASDWLRGTLLFAVWKKFNHALDVWTHFLSLLRNLKLKIQLIENSAAALYPWFTSQLYYNAYWFQFFCFFEVWMGWLNATNTCRASTLDHKSQQMTGWTE